MEKISIPICSYCQQEFPEVDKAIKQTMKKYGTHGEISFSHGLCKRHFSEKMSPYVAPDKIKASLENMDKTGKSVPDLSTHPELVQAYSQGNFIPQTTLKERLQKLANIKK
jgi:hypothetical protein